jgi:hypothetical protein
MLNSAVKLAPMQGAQTKPKTNCFGLAQTNRMNTELEMLEHLQFLLYRGAESRRRAGRRARRASAWPSPVWPSPVFGG